MTRPLSLIIILLQSAILQATVIHVPADQATIQAGIGAAISGDTVLVSRGRYFENINYRGKNIVVASQYLLSGDLTDIDSTVIDGSMPVKPDTASCVLFINGEDSTAVLCGFTLTGGFGTKWPDEHGAGTYREGGGVLTAFTSPVIRNNKIIGNTVSGGAGLSGAGGGGIRAGDGDPRILNNVIAFNQGADYGGGIVLNYCGGTVRNNIILRNIGGAAYGGGGIWLNGNGVSPRLIENNTIIGNISGSSGGGIYFLGSASATVRNTIIWANTTPQLTAGKPATYCDIEGGWSGAGNINQDPALADNNYFLLTLSSPCIDAGDSTAALNDPEDPGYPGNALWPARGGLRNDIGAYGGPGCVALPRVPTTIVPVSPLPGSVKVGLAAPLTIAFTGPVDTSTLSFTFSDPGIALIPQWNGRSDTLTLSHSVPFANLSWNSLVITAGLDSSGAALIPLPDTILFRATDTVRPRLLSTVPADGATGIAVTARPSFKFTKRVNRSSFQYLFSDTSYHFTPAWYSGDTLVMLMHNSKPFAGGKTYTLTLTAISDTFGNALGGSDVPNPFSFTTQSTGVEGNPAPAGLLPRIGSVRPNPMRSGQAAFLELDVNCSGPVRIIQYNALGQQTGDIFYGDLTPGHHMITLDRNGLAPGIYFLRIVSGRVSAIRKFTVVK